jgi:hypothetical protein
MYKNVILLLVIISLSAFAYGCSTQAAFTYPIGGKIEVMKNEPPNVKVAVLPATDLRKTSNSSGTWFLYMIPVMPFGWVDYHRPEAAKMFFSIADFRARIDEDLPKAIATHLQQAGIAKNVFFDYGGLADTADYVLRIEVLESKYHGRLISYGLSVYGPILWFIGLPGGTSSTTLDLKLNLVNKAGETIWSENLKQEWSVTQGLYYGMGRDMEGLALSLQSGLEDMLRKNPPPDLL